jgi:CheY-like chemotaxis protein
MYVEIPGAAARDPAPLLLDRLQSLEEIQRRAEMLGVEMALLRRRIAREFRCEPALDADADYRGRGTILIALEHPVLRSLAAEMLQEMGYHVVLADGRSFEPIDAALVSVPLANDENLERVRQERRWARHVVVVTAMPEGAARQRLRDAGAAGFVSTPLEPRALSACLRSLTEQD